MRKLLLSFLFVTAAALTVRAQMSQVPSQKYAVATASFWGNWFFQADVNAVSFYGDKGNTPLQLPNGLLKDFRTNMGFSVALGKWFTPGLGLRTKFNGVWGRSVVSNDKSTNAFKYGTLQEQVLFNFSNLFCGYSTTRVWNLIPYAGAGVGRNMSRNNYAMGATLGVLNQWRISRKVAVNLDLSWGIYEPDFDGAGGYLGVRGLRSKDQIVSAEIGLTYHFGRAAFRGVPDVDAVKELAQSQIDALNAQLADEQMESARLRQLLEQQPSQPIPGSHDCKHVQMPLAPVSVFFNIGQWQVASRKDLQNLKALVDVTEGTKTTLTVIGYADSATGNAALNEELSRKRAETIARELEQMGVAADRIKVVSEGGVDILSPNDYNRRVVVKAEVLP